MLLLVALINFPTIECYWKKDPLYYHELFHQIPIKYNRFTLLLKCWHFEDKTIHLSRLSKIEPLCSPLGYTCDLKIYSGQNNRRQGLDLPDSTVAELVDPLLNVGTLVITDHYYTSI